MQGKSKTTSNVILVDCPQLDWKKSKINQNIKTSHLREIENPSMSPFIKRDKTSSLLFQRERGRVRLAFSLIELIVVIVILAIL
jgi:prepilin-type N-terminal cleavage/methylation domain-containing protein